MMRLTPEIVGDAYNATGYIVAVNLTQEGDFACPVAAVANANYYYRYREVSEDDDRLFWFGKQIGLSEEYVYGFTAGFAGWSDPFSTVKKPGKGTKLEKSKADCDLGYADGQACRKYFRLRDRSYVGYN